MAVVIKAKNSNQDFQTLAEWLFGGFLDGKFPVHSRGLESRKRARKESCAIDAF